MRHDHSANNELAECSFSVTDKAMMDDFAHPAWAEAHEKFTADVAAGLARLARWLRRRAKAKDEIVIPRRIELCAEREFAQIDRGWCPMTEREPTKVNLAEKLGQFSEHWAPKIIARYNDNEVRLVKTQGEWVWHKHDETDELFLILDGEFDMEFRDHMVTVHPGELLIVPRGVDHRPAARRGEVKLLLIDPNG